ncbi:hypothetical protein ACOSP7_025531 [Xanthoceras sorbifolium]
MASSIALRRATTKLLRPCSVFRSFNTNAQVFNYDDRTVDVQPGSDSTVSRRRDTSPTFFSDVFDPFSPPRSLSQMLNLMDQFMENPFLSRGMGGSPSARRGWDVKEDDNTLVLRMDMPGISKDEVKISVQDNTLSIRGEAQTESEGEEESARRYSSRIDLPPSLYKVDEIKAEMKNGVLKVVVPKLKEEERKDVLQVKVD